MIPFPFQVGQLGRSQLAASAPVSGWNPADKGSGILLSNSNLTATQSGVTASGVRGLVSKSSGLWYVEWVINNVGGGDSVHWGIASSGTTLGSVSNSTAMGGSYLVWRSDRNTYYNGAAAGLFGGTPANGGIFGAAIDFTSGATVTLYYNGSSIYSRNLGAGSYFPYFQSGVSSGGVVTLQSTATYLPGGHSLWT